MDAVTASAPFQPSSPVIVHTTPHSKVQRVVSPCGIEAWLVEDYTVPLVAMEVCFRSGTADDLENRAGTTHLLSQLLDEGAGDHDANAFQEALEDRAIELSFSAGYHWFQGSLRTLVAHKDDAFKLMGLALNAPRLDDEPILRMKDLTLAGLKQDLTDPDQVSMRAFMQQAFPNHAYAMPPKGVIESLSLITRDDLRAAQARILTRDQVMVAVVGAIDAKTLVSALDEMLGNLPQTHSRPPEKPVMMQGLGEIVISDLDVPNSTFSFAWPSMSHHDPDYHAVMLVNHILGEGSFTSRLWHEVREKRGLSYSVRTTLSKLRDCPLVMGYLSTANERASEAHDVIVSEIRKMAEHGPTQEELDAAKAFLIGSYGLKFDSSSKIADELIDIAFDGRHIDYLESREALINAVTLEQAQRVAKRLCGDGAFLLAVAGRPVGIK
jgi:zinc protease